MARWLGWVGRARRAGVVSTMLALAALLGSACGDDAIVADDAAADVLTADTAPDVAADTLVTPDTSDTADTTVVDTADTSVVDTRDTADTADTRDTTPPGDDAADATQPGHCTSPFVYLRDGQLWRGDAPFVPVSVNYIFDIRHTPEDDYYIAPHSSFCDTPSGCCDTRETCLAAARAQLAQIAAMGVNSLRVVGLAVVPEDGTVVLDCAHQWPDWLDYCPKSAHLVMDPPDPRGLALIDDALALVAEAGLNAVFLAGHHALDADGVKDRYAAYLTTLAGHLADDPTVFAYDLMNEPVYELEQRDIDKLSAHAIGRAWYDAVRAGSRRAMVTWGLAELGAVEHWDPGVLPMDFVSWHIYGSGRWTADVRDYLSMFLAWPRTQPLPWLVGETGLSVEDGGPSEYEQSLFAQHALDTTWACGGMGLQWWLYRDTYWGPTGRGFGLVRRSDGAERPAAEVFRDFTPTWPRPACPAPAYSGSAPDGTFLTTGRLVREDGSPVAGGFVSGHKCFTGGYDWTLSRADGTFELRSTGAIAELSVTAPGLSREGAAVLCGAVQPGDITLKALPLDMRTSAPSSCPAP
ncbi:MAG: cellulase family glycosylhydrolase [Deltaproteobacteria bacterium]|nr:cellulase family glycosylhydrolase [Deltaproteobacteria bacterium]